MRSLRNDRAIQVQHAIRAAIQCELFAPAGRTASAEARANMLIARHAFKRICKGVVISGRNQDATDTIGDDVTHTGARNGARDHRKLRTHRFEQHHAEGLGAFDRWQAENLRFAVSACECRVIDVTGEAHARVDTEIARERLELRLAFAAADQQQAGLADPCDRAQQHIESLVVAQASDCEHSQVRAIGSGPQSDVLCR